MADLYERLRQIKQRKTAGAGAAGLGGGVHREMRDIPPEVDWRRHAPAVYLRDRVEPLPGCWSVQLGPKGGWQNVSPVLMRQSAGDPAVLMDPVFIDIETTGLSSGAGTVAFLIGLGRFVIDGPEAAPAVKVRQYFLADLGAEEEYMAAVLAELQRCPLESATRLYVTYNGGTFDLPVLRTRSIMTRKSFPEAVHLDLLPVTRRLYREKIGSCSLSDVESRVLHLQRNEDIPGREVPERYLEFLRGGSAHRLRPVLEHHYADIAHMAWIALYFNGVIRQGGHPSPAGCEAGFLPPDEAGLYRLRLERGPEAERPQAIDELIRQVSRGVTAGQRDWFRLADLLVTVLRRDKRWGELIATLEGLCRNRGSVSDYVDLAVQLEHRSRDYARALSLVTTAAGRYGWDPALQHRAARLHRRLQGISGIAGGTPRQSASS